MSNCADYATFSIDLSNCCCPTLTVVLSVVVSCHFKIVAAPLVIMSGLFLITSTYGFKTALKSKVYFFFSIKLHFSIKSDLFDIP